MNDQLGVAILGCGYMGQIHAQQWAKIQRAKILSVSDVDEQRSRKLAHDFEVPHWSVDYRQALQQPGVDVALVCVPTYLHAEVSIAAANQGLHVFCEKPITLTLSDAQQMITAAEVNHVKLGLGFMRRHSPVLDALKNWLESNAAARPVFYNAADVRELRPKLAMHDAQMNGGPVIDMAVHLIDLWNSLYASKAVSVSAQGLRLASGRSEVSNIADIAVDTASIQVKYESGDVGAFTVCWALPAKVNPVGSYDQIYSSAGLGEVVFARSLQEFRLTRENGMIETRAISHEDMYYLQALSFARWILDDIPFLATGEDGAAALEVALAALQSIQTGETVNIV
jgi:scyllo-inositol 2-dehydrogenase (NAD+)